MDGHRGYAEEPDARWAQERRGYGDREHDVHGIPDARYGDSSAYADARRAGFVAYDAAPGRDARAEYDAAPGYDPRVGYDTGSGYPDRSAYGEVSGAGYGEVPGAGHGEQRARQGDQSVTGTYRAPVATDPPSDVPVSRYRADQADGVSSRYRAEPRDIGTPVGGGMPNAPMPNAPIQPDTGAYEAYEAYEPHGGPSDPERDSVSYAGHNHKTGPIPTLAQQVNPAVSQHGNAPSSLYRTKRTGLAFALIGATALLELPMARGFVMSALASKMNIGGTIASLLMIIALPFFAFGCYAAIGGAAGAPGQDARVWFRTPLAYLPIALVMFLAAAVAAR